MTGEGVRAELREAAQRANDSGTPGPWKVAPFRRIARNGVVIGKMDESADAAFVAAANPAAILALLAERDALAEQVAQAEQRADKTRCAEPAPVQHCNARLPSCAEQWPDAWPMAYDPRCCRFPKSCSAEICDQPRGHEGDHIDSTARPDSARRSWPA